MYESLSRGFEMYAHFAVIFMDLLCLIAITYTAIEALRLVFSRNGDVLLSLSKGISLALDFKLGGEVVETVKFHTMTSFALLAALVLIRCGLSFYIHFKVKRRASANP